MFNDDGLGQAMANHYAEKAGKAAQKTADELTKRVEALEKAVAKLMAYVLPNQDDRRV